MGKAVSSGQHTVTCDPGASLGCLLEGLHCGTEYTFTVSATDGSCQSSDSEPLVRKTGRSQIIIRNEMNKNK